MRANNLGFSVAAALLVLAGFLVPWWPLSVAGVCLLAAFGPAPAALFVALVLDLIYGVPTGFLHVLIFPTVVLALCLVLCRSFIIRHLRDTRLY